jgi:hypothetical protein
MILSGSLVSTADDVELCMFRPCMVDHGGIHACKLKMVIVCGRTALPLLEWYARVAHVFEEAQGLRVSSLPIVSRYI